VNDRDGPSIENGAWQMTRYQTFYDAWRADFKAAGIPPKIWNRDIRAGGVTEGGKSGVSMDDRRKMAGHVRGYETNDYDRDMVEAHRRVMAKRAAFRKQNGT
jgi:hypothetical protein